MKPEQTVDFQIRKTWILISKMYNELVAHGGITTSIGMALLNIDVKTGIRSTALGPKMGMESTSLSRVLRSMEQQGLILKEADPTDKRSVVIKLTQVGIEKRNIAREVVLNFNDAVNKKIGVDRALDFQYTMNAITEVIKEVKGINS